MFTNFCLSKPAMRSPARPVAPGYRSLTAMAAAAALLMACGGNSDAAETVVADAQDQPDAAATAQVVERLSSSDTGLRSPPGLARRAFPGVAQTNLVANKPEFGAQILEPDMKNAWGIAIRPAGFGGHFWVGAAGTGKSLQYVGDVGGTPLFQDELKVVDTAGAVTGVAFNPGSLFVITQAHENGAITNPSKFFFANVSGTISAWTERARSGGGFDHPADSLTVVDGRAAKSAFMGVAVTPGADRLLAADFGADAQLRSYNGSFVEQAPLTNPFRPHGQKQPGGFEAFNVQTLGQKVFAMYGRHVPPGTVPLPAEGRLAEFDTEGRYVARWHGRGYLNYPWGVAEAPKDFGLYGGCLLVGNFGDGTIVAFHPRWKVALDYVRDASGRAVVIDGLWGLQFGNGASLGEANHLYFAAGPNKEADGLFGKLQAQAPSPRRLGDGSMCR